MNKHSDWTKLDRFLQENAPTPPDAPLGHEARVLARVQEGGQSLSLWQRFAKATYVGVAVAACISAFVLWHHGEAARSVPDSQVTEILVDISNNFGQQYAIETGETYGGYQELMLAVDQPNQ